MAIQVGERAPEFNLKDHKGREFQLSECKGKKVLLSFHPLAWTSVCAQQMQALEEHWDSFEALITVVVGVSVDSVPCKKAWAETLGVNRVPLLSDFWPHGEVARSYGILRKEGFSERANIIIGPDQKVAWVKVYPIRELPDVQEVLKVLKEG